MVRGRDARRERLRDRGSGRWGIRNRGGFAKRSRHRPRVARPAPSRLRRPPRSVGDSTDVPGHAGNLDDRLRLPRAHSGSAASGRVRHRGQAI